MLKCISKSTLPRNTLEWVRNGGGLYKINRIIKKNLNNRITELMDTRFIICGGLPHRKERMGYSN